MFVQSHGLYSPLSPVVHGDIVLRINTQYKNTIQYQVATGKGIVLFSKFIKQ